jgi:hypothetical protein
MKNKKANIFLGVVVALAVWIFGILFLPFITDDIVTARTALSCATDSISDGVMLNCLTIDLIVPYFIIFLISLALGFLAGSNNQ